MSKGGKEYQAKLTATLDYVKVLKEQGLNPNEFLTQEQRTILAEEEYREERRKQLGGKTAAAPKMNTLDRLEEGAKVDAFLS